MFLIRILEYFSYFFIQILENFRYLDINLNGFCVQCTKGIRGDVLVIFS